MGDMIRGIIEISGVMALFLSGPAGGLSDIPTSIKITNVNSTHCFVWADPLSEDEKPLEAENSPIQPTFFAKKAVSSNCTERHHFQIFYKKPIIASSGNVLKNSLTSTFCRKKAKSSLKFNELPHFVYAAKVGTKKEGFHTACLMAGSVRIGYKSKTYYFEELFKSRIRGVSN